MRDHATYEESFSPLPRRAGRGWRAVAWPLKGLLGLRRRMLVELRWRLGDELMAFPVLDALSERHPGVCIEVLTNFPALFEGRPDIRPVSGPSGAVDRYILLRGSDRKTYRPAVYAAKAGVPVPESPPRLAFSDWRVPRLEAAGLGERPFAVLAPETTWPTKKWRWERWIELCHALRESGLGTVALGRESGGLPVDLDLTGCTEVQEAARILHHARVVISCDSGLMHLGLAAGAPAIALFGPTDPDMLIRNHPRFVAIRSTASCAGFWNHAAAAPNPEACP